jgi:SAM-dependent methyltransferase
MRRTRLAEASLVQAWDRHAAEFVAWVRKPGHDSYGRFHRDLFLEILPPAGRRTLDAGCGEGRLARDLQARGHTVVGVDASGDMVAAARSEDPLMEIRRASVEELPFADRSFDLVVAFMSLQDVDDMPRAVAEAARVLEPGGRFCVAIVHPLNSAGEFAGDDPDSPFVITGSYLDPSFYADEVARDGLAMTFVSEHRPIQAYTGALADAGFLIEGLREPAVPDAAIGQPRSRRWQRVPLFLHIRAIRA